MSLEQLRPNVIMRGALFNEPGQVIAIIPPRGHGSGRRCPGSC
jgi:hypothetical protein